MHAVTLNPLPDRPWRVVVLFYNQITDWWKPHHTAVRSWRWPWGLERTPPTLPYANGHENWGHGSDSRLTPHHSHSLLVDDQSANNLMEEGWAPDSSILWYYAQLKTLFMEKWLIGSFAPVILNTARILKDARTASRHPPSKTVLVVDIMAGGCVILHRWQRNSAASYL